MSGAPLVVEFHQVVFGDDGSGQTTLLARSGPYDEELFTVADLPENLPGGYSPPAHYSVRQVGDAIAFCKTALDPAQRRAGMVRTHVLTSPATAVTTAPDVRTVLNALDPFVALEEAKRGPVSLDLDHDLDADTPPGGDALLAATVRRYHRAAEPVVWVGLDSFLDVFCYVWSTLPPTMRGALSVRLGLRAQNVYPPDRSSRTTRIIVVPQSMAGAWTTAATVGPDAPPPPSGPVLTFLQTEGGPLRELLEALDLRIGETDEISLLDQAAGLYARIGSDGRPLDLNELLMLGELGDRLAPALSKDSEFRRRVGAALVVAAEEDGGERVRNLRNFDAASYDDGNRVLAAAADAWAERAFAREPHDEDASVAGLAFRSQSEAWNQAMTSALRARLGDPDAAAAAVAWFRHDGDLVSTVGSLVPRSVAAEDAYVAAVEAQDSAAAPLRSWARSRDWAVLYAKSVQLTDGVDAALTALAKTKKGRVDEAFRRVIPHAAGEVVVVLAVETSHPALMRAAAELCAETPELLGGLDLTHASAQQVWLDAIEERGEMSDVGVRLLGDLLDDSDVQTIGADVLGDLIDRAGLTLFDDDRLGALVDWLPEPVRKRVLSRTARAWVDRFKAWASGDAVPFPAPDERVARAVAANHDARDVVPVASSLSGLVRLFEAIPMYRESAFVRALRAIYPANRNPGRVEAVKLGQFVLKRRWKSAASQLRESAGYQPGYKVAYDQTDRLFGYLERTMGTFTLFLSGGETRLDRDMWWGALRELCERNYPEGVKQKGIVEEAGGDLADMQIGGATGREQWRYVVRGLRNRQLDFDAGDLLRAMASQLPKNTEVPKMLDLYTNHIH